MTKKEEIKAKLEWYGELYDQAFERVNVSDAACVLVQQVGKDLRMARINAGSDENSSDVKQVINSDAPATEKQLALLRRLGVKEIPEDLRRGDASEMIDERKKQLPK